MRAVVYYADGVFRAGGDDAARASAAKRSCRSTGHAGNEEDLSLLDGVDVRREDARRAAGDDPRSPRRASGGCRCGAEVELGFRLLPGSRFVGVTGTNGKTTTTALLGAIFRAAGGHVAVAGNIGVPLTSRARGRLGRLRAVVVPARGRDLFACAVAVLLNLEPDHLDRYDSFEDYRDAKLRIFERARAKVVPRGLGLRRGSSSRPTTRCRPSR